MLPIEVSKMIKFVVQVVKDSNYRPDGKISKLSYERIHNYYEQGLLTMRSPDRDSCLEANQILSLDEGQRFILLSLCSFKLKISLESERARSGKKPPSTYVQSEISSQLDTIRSVCLSNSLTPYTSGSMNDSDRLYIEREFERHKLVRVE